MSQNRRSARHLRQRGSREGGGRRAYKVVTAAVALSLTAVALFVGADVAVQSFVDHHPGWVETWSGSAWLLELITTAVALIGLTTAVPCGILIVDRRRHHLHQPAREVLYVGSLLISVLGLVVSVALTPPRGGCPPHETSFPCLLLARHPDISAGWGIGLVTGTLLGGLTAGVVSRMARRSFASMRPDSGHHRKP